MTARTELPVAFVDTRADQLGFSLTAAPVEPLARVDHAFGALTVSLRLLGASHQVVVADHGAGADGSAGPRRLCETVACLPGVRAGVPDTLRRPGYRFVSRTDTYDDESLASVVGRLIGTVDSCAAAGQPALLGRFPGDPTATTAITATFRDGQVCWQTWHTYPQSGEVVYTSSAFDVAPAGHRPLADAADGSGWRR